MRRCQLNANVHESVLLCGRCAADLSDNLECLSTHTPFSISILFSVTRQTTMSAQLNKPKTLFGDVPHFITKNLVINSDQDCSKVSLFQEFLCNRLSSSVFRSHQAVTIISHPLLFLFYITYPASSTAEQLYDIPLESISPSTRKGFLSQQAYPCLPLALC